MDARGGLLAGVLPESGDNVGSPPASGVESSGAAMVIRSASPGNAGLDCGEATGKLQANSEPIITAYARMCFGEGFIRIERFYRKNWHPVSW